MNCPKCGGKAYVIDARQSDKYEGSLRRRRMCYKCKNRFTTYEILPEKVEKTIKSGEQAKELLRMINRFVETEGKHEQ